MVNAALCEIFSVSLIFYWLMCEVYFALCERVMDNAALRENILIPDI